MRDGRSSGGERYRLRQVESVLAQPHLHMWVCRENISRFRSLLARPLPVSERAVLAALLEEEQHRLDHILKAGIAALVEMSAPGPGAA